MTTIGNPKKITIATTRVLQPVPNALPEARHNFQRLDPSAQFLLAQEIVDIRGPDLCMAYHNVISVGFGYKTKRAAKSRKVQLVRTPCVTFVVSRKWRTPGKSDDTQKLPAFLWAYAHLRGKRMLCAVPTDVRPLSDYGDARPHALDRPFGVTIDRAATNTLVLGTITCAIKRPLFPDDLFALSCRHVFSRSIDDAEEASGNCPVISETSESLIGKSTVVRGPLLEGASFDAQLAKVQDMAALREALAGIRFDPKQPLLRGPGNMESGFWVATPRAGSDGNRLLIWADFHGFVMNKTFRYPMNGGHIQVAHEMLIHAVVSEKLIPGDSGSPAVRSKTGNRLIGMYLGGDGKNAFFIPAWQLIQPQNYQRAGEATWSVAAL